MNKPQNAHGTGLVLGQIGLLLRGPSGAGKSVLTLSLLDRWQLMGKTALLVGDDQVLLTADHGRISMSAPPTIAGKIELRGRGIISRPMIAHAPLHLVVDLVADWSRMPEEPELALEILGVGLARAPVPQAGIVPLGHQILLVNEAIRALGPITA